MAATNFFLWGEKKKNSESLKMHFEVLATFLIKIPSVICSLAERRWCIFDKQLLSILSLLLGFTLSAALFTHELN